ncbi:MerR family DNA-binding transcriptional regulator, partial [Streptomyces sp. NPDC002476]|uniref:MerR family DNA-binding transcriptional regulator n=1 Tax=Streptomyces sp. NPDC002476 TaxID=3364648 RepID=UPI0036739F40
MPIGVFAQRSGLTPSALRFYADSGLLPPAEVDPVTGYRYRVYSQCTGLRPGGEANLWPALTSAVDTGPYCSPRPASERPV